MMLMCKFIQTDLYVQTRILLCFDDKVSSVFKEGICLWARHRVVILHPPLAEVVFPVAWNGFEEMGVVPLFFFVFFPPHWKLQQQRLIYKLEFVQALLQD